MNEPGKERKQMGDVEPHLRTEGEIRELQPRVDFMAQRMCQTQGMVLWALKEAGLTVVLLDPRAREIAPDGAEPAVSEKHVNLAYYAAAKCEHQLQGACLSCVERALAAAEERGRRRGDAERDELRALLGKLVRAMRLWGNDEDGVPEQFYDEWKVAEALSAQSGPRKEGP